MIGQGVDHPLSRRECELIAVLVQAHAEFGLGATFTSSAIAHLWGQPCTGSLAGLVLHGYAFQRRGEDGIVYALSEKGFALFAGLEAPEATEP